MNAAPYLAIMLCCLAGCSVSHEDSPPAEEGATTTAPQALLAAPGQYGRLTARHSGKCITVSGASLDDGAQVVQWDCSGGRHQAFLLEPVNSEWYRIKALHSGKCFALNGNYIVQRDCGVAWHFKATANGDGSYSFIEPYGYALDVLHATSDNGAALYMYPPHGGNNQRFMTMAYRDQASLDACDAEPPVTGALAWCGGYYVSDKGCWAVTAPHIYEWCRRYGLNFGAEWGPGSVGLPHRYYDATDRCAYWHDFGIWDVPGDPLIHHAQAWMCMNLVQPASMEEEQARAHALYWLTHDPATLARAGAYIDPRMAARGSSLLPVPFSVHSSPGVLPQPDTFMQLPRARQQGGYWDTQQWVAGDFNGDRVTDLAKAFGEGGRSSIDVHVSGPRGFTMARWQTQSGDFWDAQRWMAGDFNGDGKTDIVNVFGYGGQTWADVHVSLGNSFTKERWQNQGGPVHSGEKWLTGDFNGDGRTDLANVFNDGGLSSIEVHVVQLVGEKDYSFVRARWATQSGGFWDAQQWIAGDFDGDGKDDLANVFNDGGLVSIDVHLSSGSGFTKQRWVTRQGAFDDGQRWMAMRRTEVDRVNSEHFKKTDLVYAFFDNGYDSIAMRRSTGSTFTEPELFARRYGVHLGHAPVSPAAWAARKWLAGKFNTMSSVARVYSDGGLASIDVYVR